MPQTAPEPIRLLWTAGFDSTFRLLELMEAGAAVQPYYVIDLARRSYGMELRQMGRIRRLIEARYPAPERLRPVAVSMRDDLRIAPDIKAAWDELARVAHIGTQYVWLAQFCRDMGFGNSEVELCMPRIDPPNALQRMKFEDPQAPELRLKPGAPQTLFGFYSFPTRHVSKADMKARAIERGFWPILERSWFCHHPIRGQPCGHCGPCKFAKDHRDGVTYSRLGRIRQALHHARAPLRQLRRRLGPVGRSA